MKEVNMALSSGDITIEQVESLGRDVVLQRRPGSTDVEVYGEESDEESYTPEQPKSLDSVVKRASVNYEEERR